MTGLKDELFDGELILGGCRIPAYLITATNKDGTSRALLLFGLCMMHVQYRMFNTIALLDLFITFESWY